MLWLKVHSHLLLRACLLSSKRKLPPQACQVRPGFPSVVCHPRGVQFPGTVYICSQGLFFKRLSPLHFLCTQCLQPLQKMLLLPTPVRQTAHGNSPELCRRSSPVPQIMPTPEKVTKNNLTIIPKPHAHPHTKKKIYAKFQNDRYKTVRGVALTRGTHCLYTEVEK